MQRHSQVDLSGTAVEDRSDPDDLPLTLLSYLHDLAHRTTGGGDVLDHQHPFPRRHLEATAQGHDAALTLAKDGAHPQGPRHFLPNDNAADGWRDHHIHRCAMKALRNPAPQGLSVLGVLQDFGALYIAATVHPRRQ